MRRVPPESLAHRRAAVGSGLREPRDFPPHYRYKEEGGGYPKIKSIFLLTGDPSALAVLYNTTYEYVHRYTVSTRNI